MTDPEALPDEDLSAWPIDDDRADDFGWDWDAPPVEREPEPIGAPWYRSPRPLLALISAAAATLVVAVALVITDSGDIPTRPALGAKTAPTAAPSPSRARPTADPVTGAPRPSTPPSASSSAEETPDTTDSQAPADGAEAAEPAAPAAAPPPAPLPVDGPGAAAGSNSEGPRINVTRSPMSFTPGSSTKG